MANLDNILTNLVSLTTTPNQFTLDNGELVPRSSSFFGKCFSLCWSPPAQKPTLKMQETYISEKVKALDSFSFDDLVDERKRIQGLFFGALSSSPYNRGVISVRGPLERILDSDVASKHDEEDQVDPVSNRKINETLSETRFSLRLGMTPEKINTRYSNIYYLFDRFHEKLGVFKPKVEIESMYDLYGSSEVREAHLAEVANSTLDRICGFGLVPYTQLFTYEIPFANLFPATGSFQFVVRDAPLLFNILEGTDLFGTNIPGLTARLDTEGNRAWNFENFGELALFDPITGNNDHHFKNLMFKASGPKKGVLVAIDNANSFPWCHDLDLPERKIKPLHTYKWAALPQAQYEFPDRVIQMMNHIDLDEIEAALRKDLVDETVPSSLIHIEGKIKTYRERIAEVRKQALNHKTMAETATLVSQLSKATEESGIIYV